MTTNSNSTMTKTSNAKNSYDTTLFTMNKTKTASVSTMTSINPIANISTSKRTTIDTATQKNSWTTKDSSNESKLENENESSMKKACKRKLPMLNDINQMITCAICSVCKSCIVQYLETSKSCPICDAPLSKTKPHQSLRQDILKQSLVYKLAPQIFIDEMKRRRRFYERIRPDCEPSSKEDAGLVPAYSYYFRPNDKISMSLEYIDRLV
ncbi:hypothetical protein QR98_0034430 [Sarcoptes scabiei]|uniref:RING-type domain-containing protein n=1 Tax=Sarcoptes scabiei TaxID=52283 RepID=A0A132A310_SARSC|nr:hypothetical protein QR98_0034430 [Sarcoptes scabiei]